MNLKIYVYSFFLNLFNFVHFSLGTFKARGVQKFIWVSGGTCLKFFPVGSRHWGYYLYKFSIVVQFEQLVP